MIYGYLFVWCGVILQALVMAEMASMYVVDTAMPMISFNFRGCCVHDVRRIWISFRHHPHDAAFGLLLAMTGSWAPEYTSSIGSCARYLHFGSLLQAQKGLGNGGHISQPIYIFFWDFADKESGSR